MLVRKYLSVFLSWIRDGWSILGITLVMFLLFDFSVGQALKFRDWQRTRSVSDAMDFHPQNDTSWFATWQRNNWPRDLAREFDAYRGWRMAPFAGVGMNISSDGNRLTVPSANSEKGRRVLMLGGSVMWGYSAEDALTIPSLTSQALQEHGQVDIEVVNAAQPGYILTQEVATLMLELRAGRVPSAVVFLDGVNDVASAAQEGEPGHVFNEGDLSDRMQIGSSRAQRLVRDIGRTTSIVEVLTTRLGRLVREQNPAEISVCDDLSKLYWNQIRIVEALGEVYGFRSLFLWQPTITTTNKPLTEWERAIIVDHPLVRLLKPCSATVVENRSSDGFMDIQDIFDNELSSVFLDQWGHITEPANAAVAERIVRWLSDDMENVEN
jgi:hypothetical protein